MNDVILKQQVLDLEEALQEERDLVKELKDDIEEYKEIIAEIRWDMEQLQGRME